MARSKLSSNGTKSHRRRGVQRQSVRRRGGQYGVIFFVVLAVTIASAVGFMGVMASVLVGG